MGLVASQRGGRGAFAPPPPPLCLGGPLGAIAVEGLRDLRAVCSAPGKLILFGEHAVVYGHPAIAAATDQRTLVEVDRCGQKFTVNGYRIHDRFHSYLKMAVERCWKGEDAIRIQTEGGVPSASGTGSSAALTVATVGALHRLQHLDDRARLAQDAYGVERATQGGGSPVDTSASTAGGGIALADAANPPGIGEALWNVSWEQRAWAVERVEVPPLTLVIGNSGVKGRTDEQVAKVARAVQKNAMLRDTLADIGAITREAVKPLRNEDWEAVGRLMDRTHSALHTLGVNHAAVQHLVDAARAAPGTFGAKITGAGGGGSMIALTEKPEALAHRLEAAGGTAFIVRLGNPGVAWHDSVEQAHAGETESPVTT